MVFKLFYNIYGVKFNICKKKHPISTIPVTFRCQCCHDTLRRNKIKILFRKKAINLNIKWQSIKRKELVKLNLTKQIIWKSKLEYGLLNLITSYIV
jgi:hypothetical protein